MMTPEELKRRMVEGRVRVALSKKKGTAVIYYLADGEYKKIQSGDFVVTGRNVDGSMIFEEADKDSGNVVAVPSSQWRISSHDSTQYGTRLLSSILPKRKFPFPKSLYAVEDCLRFFTYSNKKAVILDFFSGSGTTAHAVMRLNRQDGGRRQCISVTNNEVAAEEHAALRKDGFRPGDAEWEKWGICDYITKPRIAASITGKTPEGKDIEGDYKFIDEFPIAEGFEENAEFFTLTYETPLAVSHNRAFERIAPLLWMRAGSEGKRIDEVPQNGWAVADTYGLLTDLDMAGPFCAAVAAAGGIRVAFIVTDDERRFQAVVRQLPKGVDPVRLYESYLTNFRFSMGR